MKPLFYDLIKGNIINGNSNIIQKTTNKFTFQFTNDSKLEQDNVSTPNNLTIIKLTGSWANGTLSIDKNIKQKFKFYIHGSGELCIGSKLLDKNVIYTYTPVNENRVGDTLKIGELSDGVQITDVIIYYGDLQ